MDLKERSELLREMKNRDRQTGSNKKNRKIKEQKRKQIKNISKNNIAKIEYSTNTIEYVRSVLDSRIVFNCKNLGHDDEFIKKLQKKMDKFVSAVAEETDETQEEKQSRLLALENELFQDHGTECSCNGTGFKQLKNDSNIKYVTFCDCPLGNSERKLADDEKPNAKTKDDSIPF